MSTVHFPPYNHVTSNNPYLTVGEYTEGLENFKKSTEAYLAAHPNDKDAQEFMEKVDGMLNQLNSLPANSTTPSAIENEVTQIFGRPVQFDI